MVYVRQKHPLWMRATGFAGLWREGDEVGQVYRTEGGVWKER
jgi:hypothetical protein